MKKLKIAFAILGSSLVGVYLSSESHGSACKDKKEFHLHFAPNGNLESAIPGNLSDYTKVTVSMCLDDEKYVSEALAGYKAVYNFLDTTSQLDPIAFPQIEVLWIKRSIGSHIWKLKKSYPAFIKQSDLNNIDTLQDSKNLFPLPDIMKIIQPVFTYQINKNQPSAKIVNQSRLELNASCDKNNFYSKVVDLGKLDSTLDFSLVQPNYEMYLVEHLEAINKRIILDKNNKDSIDHLQQWVVTYLLLNQGQIQHREVKSVLGSDDKLKLKDAESRLVILEKEIDLLKVMMVNYSASESNPKDSAINNTRNHLVLYTDLLKQKNVLNDTITEIKKRIPADKPNTVSKVVLNDMLYKGTLLTSESSYSRYHNSQNQYVLSKPAPIEITESESMHIMINNCNGEETIKLQYQTTPVTQDESYAARSLLIRMLDGGVAEDTVTKIANLLMLRETLRKQLDKYFDDTKPAYQTIEVGHEVLAERAPFLVPYSITGKDMKGKDSIVSNTNIGYNYRVNKLYRFRFKPGLAFSWFEHKNYTVDGNNIASVVVDRHGVDAIFGMQTFFNRQDIRSPKFNLRPFGYIGFSFKNNPTDNLFLGGGFELINGVALMGGYHISQTSKLVNNGGILSVETKRWGLAPFASVSVDLAIFNRFFAFDGATLPKAK